MNDGVNDRGLAVAVIGAGWMGREHADSIKAAGDAVVAVVDTDMARAAQLCSDCGSQPAAVPYPSIAEMLRAQSATGRALSAAAVCSPSSAHLEQLRELVEAGVAVLMEKPPWIVGQDPEPVLNLAAERGVTVAVGMTTRFEPGVRELRSAARAGEFGRILSITDEILYQLREGDLPEWYTSSPAAGGGVVLTNGVHAVDRTSWILGRPLRLTSTMRATIDPRRGCEDYAALSLRPADTIGEDGDADTARVEIRLLWSEYEPPVPRLQVLGTLGSGWVDGTGRWVISGAHGQRSGLRPAGHNNHHHQWSAFRRLVGGNGWTGELAGLADLKPTMAAVTGAATGANPNLQGFGGSQVAPDGP